MDKEINSAELEAEQILKDAFSRIRAEECPQGEDCSVHFRVDSVYRDDEYKYIRCITYLGNFAVVTDDNHNLRNPARLLAGVFGLPVAPMDRWETTILHVGEGVLDDLWRVGPEEHRKAIRYVQPHDTWEDVEEIHHNTVSLMAAGMIDLSRPWKDKG